jgi:hypothetical protein
MANTKTSNQAVTMSRLAAAALREVQARPQHFQLLVGGMRAIRELEGLGLAKLHADNYVRTKEAA